MISALARVKSAGAGQTSVECLGRGIGRGRAIHKSINFTQFDTPGLI